jgi:hypothetical protein
MSRRSPYSVHTRITGQFIGRNDGYPHPAYRGDLDGSGGGMVHESSDAG